MTIRRISITLVLVMALAALVALTGCSYSAAPPASSTGSTPPAAGGAAGGEKAVTMQGFAFSPAALDVTVGTTVKWTNQDTAAHTVTSDDGTIKSDKLAQGASFTYTFTKVGTFPYHCSIHPNMVGQIVVK